MASATDLDSVDHDAYKVAVMRRGCFRPLTEHFSVDAVLCGSNQPQADCVKTAAYAMSRPDLLVHYRLPAR